jgi:hypothetical protein
MTYDVALWVGEHPADDAAAAQAFDELWERYEDSSEPPAKRILDCIDELTAKYPDLDELPNEEVDDSPWAEGSLRRNVIGPFFYAALVPSKADETIGFIAETARRHDLICFDPQQDRLL